MSKVKSLKKALAKVTRSVEKANKSSKGKESKLEEAVKQIEDMSKKPAFVRLRQMANKNRKRKGLPLKPELSDIPEARQKMMTPAQKRRARKTQKDLGPSARRDMKDAKPPIERFKGGPVSKIKEKSVSDQVKLLNKSRSSAEKTEKKLRSMGDELDLKKKTKKQLEKDYGTNAKKPVEKANGGLATSRSRKPRGVGAALRGYGKALQ